MAGSFHRRIWVLFLSAAIAFAAWNWVPGSPLDRAAFTIVARAFANPPFLIGGTGSHASPWSLRTYAGLAKQDPAQAPVVVSLGDDPEGFFQTSPPSPVDLAVILTNIRRLGAKKAAIAAVLAWDEPDPIALAALENSMDRLESLLVATPLSRGAVASTMPPGFRNASIPIAAVKGDASMLPIVNRLSIPDAVLGGENARCGFSILDSEPGDTDFPLVARWEDRVVFAFPVLAVMLREALSIENVEVVLGQYLRLGSRGPTVPLDRFGRLPLPLKPLPPLARIPAENVVDGENLFPADSRGPVILRDDQSAAEPATRHFSRMLAARIAAIATDAGLSSAVQYPRLPDRAEWGILGAMVIFVTVLAGAGSFARVLGWSMAAGVLIAAHLIGVGMAGVHLPTVQALLVIVAALPFGKSSPQPPVQTLPDPLPPVVAPPDSPPAPPPPPAPEKKAPPKKRAAQKPPAKKAARKRSPPPRDA